MTQKLDILKELYSTEVKRFETLMSERTGRNVTLRDIALKEFVDVDGALLAVKVADLAIQGARDEAEYWREIAHLHPMSEAKEEVPLYSARNFAVRTGKVTKNSKQDSGGKVSSVTLDVSDSSKDRYIYLQVDGRDIELKRFINVENAIKAAGAAFAKHVRDEILTRYLADKGADVEQALGADSRYKAIMSLASKMNKKGFRLNTIIIDSDDLVEASTEVIGNTMPWVLAMQNGGIIDRNQSTTIGNLNGLIGFLGGKVPVYAVGDTSASLNGTILGVDKMCGEVVGLSKDMVLNQSLDKISDLLEAVLTMRYDIAHSSECDNAIGWVSGA